MKCGACNGSGKQFSSSNEVPCAVCGGSKEAPKSDQYRHALANAVSGYTSIVADKLKSEAAAKN
jgi:DnaJ-class molecular chaperone